MCPSIKKRGGFSCVLVHAPNLNSTIFGFEIKLKYSKFGYVCWSWFNYAFLFYIDAR